MILANHFNKFRIGQKIPCTGYFSFTRKKYLDRRSPLMIFPEKFPLDRQNCADLQVYQAFEKLGE